MEIQRDPGIGIPLLKDVQNFDGRVGLLHLGPPFSKLADVSFPIIEGGQRIPFPLHESKLYLTHAKDMIPRLHGGNQAAFPVSQASFKGGAAFFPVLPNRTEGGGSRGDSLSRETRGFWSFFNKLREKKPLS